MKNAGSPQCAYASPLVHRTPAAVGDQLHLAVHVAVAGNPAILVPVAAARCRNLGVLEPCGSREVGDQQSSPSADHLTYDDVVAKPRCTDGAKLLTVVREVRLDLHGTEPGQEQVTSAARAEQWTAHVTLCNDHCCTRLAQDGALHAWLCGAANTSPLGVTQQKHRSMIVPTQVDERKDAPCRRPSLPRR